MSKKNQRPKNAGDLATPLADRDRAVIAPADAQSGILGEAIRSGDYRAFRMALSADEERLRKRVGRWIQRYPDAEARLGHGLAIGDVVEEVYLNAFESYSRRPMEVPLHEWLDSLIDRSLKMLLHHPEKERENASFARTVREIRGES